MKTFEDLKMSWYHELHKHHFPQQLVWWRIECSISKPHLTQSFTLVSRHPSAEIKISSLLPDNRLRFEQAATKHQSIPASKHNCNLKNHTFSCWNWITTKFTIKPHFLHLLSLFYCACFLNLMKAPWYVLANLNWKYNSVTDKMVFNKVFNYE